MEKYYIVSWAVTVAAESPEDAAILGFKEMRNPESERRFMSVQDKDGNTIVLDPLKLINAD